MRFQKPEWIYLPLGFCLQQTEAGTHRVLYPKDFKLQVQVPALPKRAYYAHFQLRIFLILDSTEVIFHIALQITHIYLIRGP